MTRARDWDRNWKNRKKKIKWESSSTMRDEADTWRDMFFLSGFLSVFLRLLNDGCPDCWSILKEGLFCCCSKKDSGLNQPINSVQLCFKGKAIISCRESHIICVMVSAIELIQKFILSLYFCPFQWKFVEMCLSEMEHRRNVLQRHKWSKNITQFV